MKVLFVNASDIVGGAARAAYRLHRGLRRGGVQSHLLVQAKASDDHTVLGPQSNMHKLAARLRPFCDSIPTRLYKNRGRTLFSPAWLPFSPVMRSITSIDTDIIHLHWVAGGMLRIEELAKVRQALVWTLHDMWAFTGGCHYDNQCGRYRYQCGRCPVLGSDSDKDLSRQAWVRKQRVWKNLNMVIVTPSCWLAECVKDSSLLGDKRVEVIPNGLDTRRFHPMDKIVARRLLSLSPDKRLILFGAMSSTSDKRKGFKFLHPALHELSRSGWGENAELVVFGASEPVDPPDFGLRASYLGRLHDDISLALLYAAADVFVAPSLQDNLPNTVMESLACGTPSVAFNIGGMPDMIEHKYSGYLARPFETDDLARGISWVLQDDQRLGVLSRNAREKVEREFALEKIAKRYVALYEDILRQRKGV